MTEPTASLELGEGDAARPIVVDRRPGAAPGLFWLGGFRSDRTGGKALALDAHGAARGLAVTRFDYSGHGDSGGRFEDGTISRWLEESLAVFDATVGEQILVGSSMGGWLALLVALARRTSPGRIRALVLIAPAADFTEDLMWAGLPPEVQRTILADGVFHVPAGPTQDSYPITRALIEDGRRHLVLGAEIPLDCPVTILQGVADTSVPWRHALRLVSRLTRTDVTLTLVPDGDHRLSRPQDLERLLKAVDAAIG
ncbi:alpha/beta hydrolase [Siculibacillus lacustris]|uniref:alpha/beta hydrolase n=1 Tax=Siculibacillus lacustris TaxID=1549641 RepID=UPI001D1865A0|nr:alpha/beta hydrolase [Siculibacillus lacustris]